MLRPCESRHPQPVSSGCRLCHLFLTRADYRRLWGGPDEPPEPVKPRVSLPCVHVGPVVRIAGSNRNWRSCAKGVDHGQGPGMVCSCKGCGPKCPDYLPDA